MLRNMKIEIFLMLLVMAWLLNYIMDNLIIKDNRILLYLVQTKLKYLSWNLNSTTYIINNIKCPFFNVIFK